MSVLINMDMPKNCGVCELCGCYTESKGEVHRCDISMYVIKDLENRLDDCPLIPVPPHGRLGDLDRLERMFADIDSAPYSCFDGEEPFYSAADAAQIIRLAPTIIPAEEGET